MRVYRRRGLHARSSVRLARRRARQEQLALRITDERYGRCSARA
jgi:hypothetical protein